MSWLSLLILLPLMKEVPTEPATTAPVVAGEAQEVREGDPGLAEEGLRPRRGRPPAFGVQLDLASTYVFRGELQHGSPVIPSFQPSFWLDFSHLLPGSLQVGLWGAFAMADRERVRREATASELDVSLTYEQSLAQGWLDLGGGFLYYLYPGQEEVDGEKELFLRLGLGNLPISIALTTFLEVHPGLGIYFEPTIGWEQEFGDFTVGTELVLGAGVARGEQAALEHLTLTASVSHAVGRLAFGVSLSYALRLEPSGLDFFDRSLIFGNVSLSFNPPEQG